MNDNSTQAEGPTPQARTTAGVSIAVKSTSGFPTAAKSSSHRVRVSRTGAAVARSSGSLEEALASLEPRPEPKRVVKHFQRAGQDIMSTGALADLG